MIFSAPLNLPSKLHLRRQKSSHFWRCLLITILLVSLLPACGANLPSSASSSVFSDWKLADLQLLQSPGTDPGHSLIALYSRESSFDLEIRLDFLDLSGTPDFDVYLALDTQPGGSSTLPITAKSGFDFDVLLEIPAAGVPKAFDAQLQPLPDLLPRSASHPGLDALTLQINRASLPGNSSGVSIQAWITPSGKPQVLSQTPPVYPAAAQPAQAPLLLVFWNTLPAASPAQILRRWDGAHTGPYGGRHGLNVLLQAAVSQKVPLVLADLTQPASLTALSAVGGLNQVRQSSLRGDVILPESANGDPMLSDLSLTASRLAAISDKFETSSIAFGAFSAPLPDPYAAFFADLPDRSHILNWQAKRLIPLPESVFPALSSEIDPQVDYDGFTIHARTALLLSALSSDPGDLVVLGGSLPESAWGEFSIAPAAFAYIAAHPWIKPLYAYDLNVFPTVSIQNWPLDENCHDLLCSSAMLDVVPVTEFGPTHRFGFTSASDSHRIARAPAKFTGRGINPVGSAVLSFFNEPHRQSDRDRAAGQCAPLCTLSDRGG